MPEDKAVQPGVSGKIPNKRLALVLLVVLAVAVALPMWCVHYPPLLDFPTHVASTFVLAQLHNPHYDFARYYAAEWAPTPYITTDVLMVAFSRVMPALIAGKLMFSLRDDRPSAGGVVFSAADKSRRRRRGIMVSSD